MSTATEALENEDTPIVNETLDELEVEAQAAQDKYYEDRARRMGWRPKDEYGGDKSRWVDAKTFVERGETELPILRERFRKLDDRLVNTERELTDTKKKLTETTEVLVELRDMSYNAQEQGYQRAKAELREREARAVAEANTESWAAIQREKDALEQSRPKPKPEVKPAEPTTPAGTPQTLNPVIQQWISENPWFNTDRILNAYALAEDAEVERENPTWAMDDKLAEVKRRVVARFPEKFGNPRREAPPAVAVSTAAPAKSKGKTVKDLPAEARKALDRFKKTIPGYKDEDYLKLYFAEEA